VLSSVVDPHHFGNPGSAAEPASASNKNPDPHPDPHEIKFLIRIRIGVISQDRIRSNVMRIHNTVPK
jgi:hypothetical protein